VTFGRNQESRSCEAAGRRNWPEAVPRKISDRKRPLPDSVRIGVRRRVELGGKAEGTVETRRLGGTAYQCEAAREEVIPDECVVDKRKKRVSYRVSSDLCRKHGGKGTDNQRSRLAPVSTAVRRCSPRLPPRF
jgi:hypothetical protein